MKAALGRVPRLTMKYTEYVLSEQMRPWSQMGPVPASGRSSGGPFGWHGEQPPSSTVTPPTPDARSVKSPPLQQ